MYYMFVDLKKSTSLIYMYNNNYITITYSQYVSVKRDNALNLNILVSAVQK